MESDLSFIQDIPFEIYLEDASHGQYLTAHFLKDFMKCPQLYKQKLTGEILTEDKTAFQIGRATHTLVLCGQEAFDAEYLVSSGPINPRTGEPYGKVTKAYKEWAAEQTKKIVLTDEYEFMTKLQEAVWAHPKVNELLDGCIPEGTIRVEYMGEKVQIRMDAFNPSSCSIVDLKTCDNLDFFPNDCFKFGYAEQMAFYREVFKIASGGALASTWLIAVEKRVPYRCGVWQVTDAMLEHSKTLNEAALEELKICKAQDVWPTRYEDVRLLDIPQE